jgi:ubiquinone/menaquinone biosynthesis C-methylase UbiE
LGCWDWRLFWYIEEFYPNLIAKYTGVDISHNLLSIAKKKFSDSKKAQRVHDDMIHYLSTCQNESVDSIICIASFQHLPDSISRNTLVSNMYRVLVYNGSLSSVDWSWSIWMIQKHGKLLWKSLKKKFLTQRKRERNNLLIPFTHQWITKQRLYHIFTVFELKRLLVSHGFHNALFIYSGQDWSFHHNILKARNICTYVQKKVFYEI